MNNQNVESRMKWEKLELTVIDMKEYEKMIVANASSGCMTGGGGGACNWYVSCVLFA